jgi:hypothetical protein
VNAAVDVIVDRQDDIATVKAIHALSAREPGVLAVSILPGLRSETEVIWAILRALGKRVEQLTPNIKVWWIDAERWLTAHRINEIALLCAQHLDEHMIDELKAHVCRRPGIALALIYGRPVRAGTAAMTDLGAYLSRTRDPPPRGDQAEPWPVVPRSHPLRFRYDCWRELEPEQFARVERRLFGCMTMLGGWCRSTEPSRLPEIERAYRIIIAADDPELAYTRRCGAKLALITHQIPTLLAAPLSLRPHAVTARQLDAVHAYTNPARAGYHLAKLITRLPDELLALIGRDQITAEAILGCPVPDAARPILRAIEDRHEPVLDIPWRAPGEPSEDATDQDITTELPSVERDFATALGSLLHGRSVRIPSRDLSRTVRARFEALRADGMLDRRCRVYRASHSTLYSSFRVDSTADPGTDNRAGRSTDISRESQ